VSVCLALWGRPNVQWKLSPEGTGNGDAALWAEFVDDLASGKPYYETAVIDYRARGYPTFSVVNFRQPMLYQSMAWLGVSFMFTLRAAAVLLLIIRVWQQFGRWPWVAAVAHACLFVAAPVSVYFAETWAGVLIGLSLLAALRGNVAMSVAWAVVGLSIREIVAPYCVVMVALAVYRYRWGEVLMWVSGGIVYLATYAVHAANALRVIPVDEPASYTYFFFGGLALMVRAIMFHGLFAFLPLWGAVPVLTALIVAGMARNMPAELRWTGIAYMAFFFVVGQPFNNYWGAVAAPVLACWLPFAAATPRVTPIGQAVSVS
jgi:hypothetical protein